MSPPGRFYRPRCIGRPIAQALPTNEVGASIVVGVGLSRRRRGHRQVIIAELGPDMSRFATHRHPASWAAICPGHDESAGKRRSGKTRKGDSWLRTALIEAAQSAAGA